MRKMIIRSLAIAITMASGCHAMDVATANKTLIKALKSGDLGESISLQSKLYQSAPKGFFSRVNGQGKSLSLENSAYQTERNDCSL